jgi:hypothetical protein
MCAMQWEDFIHHREINTHHLFCACQGIDCLGCDGRKGVNCNLFICVKSIQQNIYSIPIFCYWDMRHQEYQTRIDDNNHEIL